MLGEWPKDSNFDKYKIICAISTFVLSKFVYFLFRQTPSNGYGKSAPLLSVYSIGKKAGKLNDNVFPGKHKMVIYTLK
jgi:hypothetical protein